MPTQVEHLIVTHNSIGSPVNLHGPDNAARSFIWNNRHEEEV
jgi:hypothetical protein